MTEEVKEKIGPKSKKQHMILHQNADIAIVGGSMGCCDRDTEYLTPYGWKKFSDYVEGDLVAQYDQETNTTTFVKPLNYIKLPAEKLYRMQAKGLDFCLSPEHRVPYWWDKDNHNAYKVISYEEVMKRHTASATKGWTGAIKTTYQVQSEGIDLTEGEIRLQIAAQADGHFPRESKDNYCIMRFSKKRKYDRLLDLCNKFGLKYKDKGVRETDKYLSGVMYEVIIWPKRKDKVFKDDWWLCSQEQLEWIADEAVHWDGNYTENLDSKSIHYYCIHKENVDFLQYAYHACGYNTSICPRDKGGNVKRCWYLNAFKFGKGFRAFANKDGKVPIEEYKTLDGYKYCFTVPSGLLLLRRSDSVFISGNSGKSYIALLYPLKFAHDPHLRGVIFRKTTNEITAQGGLWETACELYAQVFGLDKIKIHKKDLKITFPSGGSVKFSHLETDQDRFKHQGAQYSFVLFDEATHFNQLCIEYLMLRVRSARAKHKLQMVLTCNPDPDWFALEWIKPYLTELGTPNQDMDGVIRYYVVEDNKYIWGSTKEELEAIYGTGDENGIKSFTFISASCYDNPVLLKNQPNYISTLKSKNWVDVQRYLYG